jgi:hypothetical protein
MTRAAKPFTSLTAALRVFDAGDLCGDLDLIAADANRDEVEKLEEASGALRCAESVETMSDFVANLRDAVEALRPVKDAAQVSAEITRFINRCAA